MKYTSLYWALRFVENELDVYTKEYNGYGITIEAEKQVVNYGNKILRVNKDADTLTRHKDFVILECIDRLLTIGYKPQDIIIVASYEYDIKVGDISIICEQWGNDYLNAQKKLKSLDNCRYTLLYTSRLVSGLLEYKNVIMSNDETFNYGIFDRFVQEPIKLLKAKEVVIEQVEDINDFEILEDELIRYTGTAKVVKVPEGITTIGASAFWNCINIEKITLPQSLKRLGGDAFYYCRNLTELIIPKQVWIMGNDPFAECPKLTLKSQSPYFVLEDSVLYNKNKDNLIHYSSNKMQTQFVVPESVTCLGKHCFYNAKNLEQLIIPSSVIRFENNPFSGCDKLKIENYSKYYHIADGVIYNKFMTTIVGVLNNTQTDCLIIPKSVTLISRNSFWNCKGIKKIILTENITRIGYNPFVSCTNLELESENHRYNVIDGILYNEELTELICCTNKAAAKVKIPCTVKKINRSAFSGCDNLIKIDFSNVEIIDKSAFTNCINLTQICFTDNVTYIGEWAFAYCTRLKNASVSIKTKIERNAFNECPISFEVRK